MNINKSNLYHFYVHSSVSVQVLKDMFGLWLELQTNFGSMDRVFFSKAMQKIIFLVKPFPVVYLLHIYIFNLCYCIPQSNLSYCFGILKIKQIFNISCQLKTEEKKHLHFFVCLYVYGEVHKWGYWFMLWWHLEIWTTIKLASFFFR